MFMKPDVLDTILKARCFLKICLIFDKLAQNYEIITPPRQKKNITGTIFFKFLGCGKRMRWEQMG